MAFIVIQDKEKESWEAASQALKTKLELAESNCIRAEIEVAKMRSIFASLIFLLSDYSYMWSECSCFSYWAGQLASDVSAQTQILNTKDAELVAAEKEVSIYSYFPPWFLNSFLMCVCVREKGWNIAPILQVRKWITICFTSLLFKMFFILPLYVVMTDEGPTILILKACSLSLGHWVAVFWNLHMQCRFWGMLWPANCWKVFQCLWYRNPEPTAGKYSSAYDTGQYSCIISTGSRGQ